MASLLSRLAAGFAAAALVIGSLSPVNAQILNGSFETADYTSWTLFEDSGSPTAGTWGIAPTGLTINPGNSTFDFYNSLLVSQSSPGLPRTYTASDGRFMAYQLQNGSENHRMFQDITLGASATTLNWDMFYHNFSGGGFVPGVQQLRVNIRNLADTILTTLFVTAPSDPLSIPMTSFSANIAPFAGSTVRLDVEMNVQDFYFDAGFDNFKINSSAVPEPSSIALLSGIDLVGLAIAYRRKRKVVV